MPTAPTAATNAVEESEDDDKDDAAENDEEEEMEDEDDKDDEEEDEEDKEDSSESEPEPPPPVQKGKRNAKPVAKADSGKRKAGAPEAGIKRRVSFGKNSSLDHLASIKKLKGSAPPALEASPAKGILAKGAASPKATPKASSSAGKAPKGASKRPKAADFF
jgi:hypothetical protein